MRPRGGKGAVCSPLVLFVLSKRTSAERGVKRKTACSPIGASFYIRRPSPVLTLRWLRCRFLHALWKCGLLAGSACCLRRPGGTRRSPVEVQTCAWEAKAKSDEPGRRVDHTRLLAPEREVCTDRRRPRKTGCPEGVRLLKTSARREVFPERPLWGVFGYFLHKQKVTLQQIIPCRSSSKCTACRAPDRWPR